MSMQTTGSWPCIRQCFIRGLRRCSLSLSALTCSQDVLCKAAFTKPKSDRAIKKQEVGMLSWLCNVCIPLSMPFSLSFCLFLSLSVSVCLSRSASSPSSRSLSMEMRCQTGQWYLPALAQTNKPVLWVNCSTSTDPRSGHRSGNRLFQFHVFLSLVTFCGVNIGPVTNAHVWYWSNE